MSPTPSPQQVQTLLEQSTWLAALARRLVGDASGADDLVQETLIAAIQAKRQPHTGQRAWLGAILRNKVRDAFSSAERRDYREREAARAEALPGPDELSSVLESERLLRDALDSLPEPQRSTVLLRYREGLSAAEIARRQGTPAGTVRWRLKSGLDQLRAELESTHGESSWAGLLLPLALRAPSFELYRNAGTPLLVPWLAKMALVLVAVIGAGTGIRAVATSNQQAAALDSASNSTSRSAAGVAAPQAVQRPAVAMSSVDDSSATPARTSATVVVGRVSDGESASATTASSDSSASHGALPVPELAPGLLRVRVLDDLGEPLAGAVLRKHDDDHFDRLGAPSASDGVLHASLDQQRRATQTESLEIAAPGRASELLNVQFESGVERDLGDIVLMPGGTLRGRVVDERGLPIRAGVVLVGSLGVVDGPLGFERMRDAELRSPFRPTDSQGRFELDGAQVGRGDLVVFNDDIGAVCRTSLDVQAAGDVQVGDVLLSGEKRRRSIRQIVADISGVIVPPAGVDPRELSIEANWIFADGRSKRISTLTSHAHHQIGVASSSVALPDSARVDGISADGSFRLTGSRRDDGEPSTVTLTVFDPGLRVATFVSSELAPQSADLEFVLESKPTYQLDVRMPNGEIADVFKVRILRADRWPVRVDVVDAVSCLDGQASLPLPLCDWRLAIEADGASRVLGPFEGDLDPGALTAQLRLSRTLHGRVVRGSIPIANATLRALPVENEGVGYTYAGIVQYVDPFLRGAEDTTTDAEGRFAFNVEQTGRVCLAIRHESVIGGDHGMGDVETTFLLDDVQTKDGDCLIDLASSACIEGQINRFDPKSTRSLRVAASNGYGVIRSVDVEPDGSFSIDDLSPGEWECFTTPWRWSNSVPSEPIEAESFVARIRPAMHRRGPLALRGCWRGSRVTLSPGETARVELDADQQLVARVTASFALDGKVQWGNADNPASVSVMRAESPGERSWARDVTVDRRGRCSIDLAYPARYEFHYSGDFDEPALTTFINVDQPDAITRVFDFETGSIVLNGSDREPWYAVRVRCGDGQRAYVNLRAGDSLSKLPAGKIVVQRTTSMGDGMTSSFAPAYEGSLEPGETLVVELP